MKTDHKQYAGIIFISGLMSLILLSATLFNQHKAYKSLFMSYNDYKELRDLNALLKTNDDIMEMSLNMNAYSGQISWETKYFAARRSLGGALQRMQVMMNSPMETQEIKNVISRVESLDRFNRKIFERVRYDDFDKAKQLIFSLERERISFLLQSGLEKLTGFIESKTKMEIESASQEFRKSIRTLVILMVFLVVFWIFLIRTLRAINKRLMDLNRDLDQKVQEKSKELEASHLRMMHASKMVTLGEAAGGIAHEINNPVAVISIKSQQMQDILQDNYLSEKSVDVMRKMLITIDSMCVRITRIITSMKSAARNTSSEPHLQVSLSKIMEEVGLLCSERMKRYNI